MAELQSQAASGEEFYEKIEAPKFVDFTKPDLPRPDDRYWFCLRVGCDQKHEEEMDHEAIYKDFVLRVMAARSPNVRFRKVLNRKAPSTTMKCPLSAPAKPSKSRLSRLAMISSFSQKITEAKVKGSTPKPEVKKSSVVVKALTTPRNKKCPPNLNSFQSVRNPKPTTIAVPKNRVVAKVLIFHSPKKPRQKKTSLELHTPVSKICQGMKQIEITSQRKRVLGYSVKSSRDVERDSNKQLPSDASRRKFGTRKVKSRVYDSLRSYNSKGMEAKPSSCPKRKTKVEDLQKCNGSLPNEAVENDSSDMEIDEKLRDNSMDGSSLSCSSKSYEGNGHDKKPSQIVHSDAALSDTSKGDMNSTSEENNFSEFQTLSEEGTKSSGGSDVDVKTESSSSLSDPEDRDSEQKNMPQFQIQTGEGNESSGGSEHEEKTKSSSRKRRFLEDYPPQNQISEEDGHHSEDKESNEKENASASDSEEAGQGNEIKEERDETENASASDDKENNCEAMENDDKENASAPDDNRKLKSDKDHCERKLLGRQGAGGTMKKVTQVPDRTCKESFNSAAASVKRKPKPTNPKPFRLRTDERGILKEANLERRLHRLAPLKETAAVSRFPSVTSQRRNVIAIQRNEKSPGQEARSRSDTHDEGSEKEPEKITQNQPQQIKTACKNSRGRVEQRIGTTTPRRRTGFKYPEPYLVTPPVESDKEDEPQSSSRKKKSSLLQKKLVSTQGITSSSKGMVSLMKTGKFSVIKEISPTISGPKENRKPWERSDNPATKAPPASRGRRPTTIPKEPNFHSIHTPKSCTRKLA